MDLLRTFHRSEQSRHAQTAFCAFLLARHLRDFRVYHIVNAARLWLRNKHAAQNADLRAGNADALALPHRLQHISQDHPDMIIHLRNLPAVFAQNRISLFYYISQCHISSLFLLLSLTSVYVYPHQALINKNCTH